MKVCFDCDPAGDACCPTHQGFDGEIQRSGQLFTSGPLDLDVEHISGMCILHAPSRFWPFEAVKETVEVVTEFV
jgi:hypothetical protein